MAATVCTPRSSVCSHVGLSVFLTTVVLAVVPPKLAMTYGSERKLRSAALRFLAECTRTYSCPFRSESPPLPPRIRPAAAGGDRADCVGERKAPAPRPRPPELPPEHERWWPGVWPLLAAALAIIFSRADGAPAPLADAAPAASHVTVKTMAVPFGRSSSKRRESICVRYWRKSTGLSWPSTSGWPPLRFASSQRLTVSGRRKFCSVPLSWMRSFHTGRLVCGTLFVRRSSLPSRMRRKASARDGMLRAVSASMVSVPCCRSFDTLPPPPPPPPEYGGIAAIFCGVCAPP